MRVALAILLIIAFITPALGQDARKVLAENVRSTDKIVKGAPFSAEAISESVQTLADGNRITRRNVSRLYRDSEGRFRREEMPRELGVPGAVVEMPQSISITDPVAGIRYSLNPKNQTFRQSEFRQAIGLKKKLEEKAKAEEEKLEAKEARLKQEIAKQAEQEKQQEIGPNRQAMDERKAQREEAVAKRKAEMENRKVQLAERKAELKTEIKQGIETDVKNNSDSNSKTESLGGQIIEGVQAEGTRTTTTIPAGAIGNEMPIEVVYERWYSPELQLIVLSKHSDPRFGVQTYRLTNLNRSEQPITLFSPPPDYRPAEEKSPKPPAALAPKAPAASPSPKALPALKKASPPGPAELKKT